MRSTPIITGLVFVAAGAYVIGGTTLMLWLSGDWRWVEGWIFGVWWGAFIAALFWWLRYRDPALFAERMRMPGSGGESRADLGDCAPAAAAVIKGATSANSDARVLMVPAS